MGDSYKCQMLLRSKCLLVLLPLFREGAFLAWKFNQLFMDPLPHGQLTSFLSSPTATGQLPQGAT